MKEFSVIIPCYNAQEYIDRVMNSVMEQTLDNDLYEVIAVNDASTDDTLMCLNEWAGKYPDTIRVITYNTNLRQGGARNRAMKEASGEYICFLDADDWMEPDALEFFSAVTGGGYDIITALFVENTKYGILYDEKGDSGRKEVNIQKIFNSTELKEYLEFDLGFVWSSVYRREMIADNGVWFPEHLAYEDVYWQRLIKFYAKNACVLDRVTHHHYNHPESTMNRKNAAHHIDRLTCYEMLLEEYSKRGFLKDHYPQILKDTMETYLFNSYYMFFTMMDDIPDVYTRIRKTIYEYFPDWETEYDDSEVPMVLCYLLKFLKKAVTATPESLKPFKDSILEIIEE